MNPEVLEIVLGCKALPSLPAIAMQVIELTQNDRVSVKDLAETIQNDQALTLKILRTANSSMFGLRTRCSSINQAIVMLGLSTVKTLALGFTLVTAIRDASGKQLDLGDHWRRALYTGVAARAIATRAGLENPEECFLGGLVQDVGVIALHRAFGNRYLDIVARTEGDHRVLAELELKALEAQHPDIGAMLASRWRLPDALVMPIKYHERPTAAPAQHGATCRAVGLGNIASDALTCAEPVEPLRRFYSLAERWFGLSQGKADEALKSVSAASRELAGLLSVPVAAAKDANEVLRRAREQLATVEIPCTATTAALREEDPTKVDALTGAATRELLDQTLVAAFEQTKGGVGPVSLAIVEVDDLPAIRERCGEEAQDTIMIEVAQRLERQFAPAKALVGRYDDARFAVLMPRIDRVTGVRLTEEARRAIAADPVRLIAAKQGSPPEVAVTASIGIAALDPATADRFEEPDAFSTVAEQAVVAARRAGRNTVRVFNPGAAAA